VADISYVMLAAARQLAQGCGGKVVAVLLGHEAQSLAKDLGADLVVYFDHPALSDFIPEAYKKVLASLVEARAPRALLFGHTTMGTDVASVLSARLGMPLISQCQVVRAEGGTLKYVSQICGGKIMAEGELPEPTVILTMVPGGFKPEQGKSAQPAPLATETAPALDGLKMTLKQYIEPEAGDVDITKEPVLVAVGRGIQNQDNIELAEALAEALGGVVCASRPVVDQGWLPAPRLVGKSGKSVKPKVYLAFGISGAPEHAEAITGSETIIAVNTDPAAPIFDIAKYGTETDMFDLLEVLTEKVKEAKGG